MTLFKWSEKQIPNRQEILVINFVASLMLMRIFLENEGSDGIASRRRFEYHSCFESAKWYSQIFGGHQKGW